MSAEGGPPRWRICLDQFRAALVLFHTVEEERRHRALNDAEKAGLVQFFALSVELGWKTLAAYLRSEGVDVVAAPMPVIRRAAEAGLVEDADAWARAVEDRNRFAHVYDAAAFDPLAGRAGDDYLPAPDALVRRLAAIG